MSDQAYEKFMRLLNRSYKVSLKMVNLILRKLYATVVCISKLTEYTSVVRNVVAASSRRGLQH